MCAGMSVGGPQIVAVFADGPGVTFGVGGADEFGGVYFDGEQVVRGEGGVTSCGIGG